MEILIKRFQKLPIGADYKDLVSAMVTEGHDKDLGGVLTRLMQSGEMEKIYTKWFVSPIPPKNMSLNLSLSPALKALFATPNDKPLETYLK